LLLAEMSRAPINPWTRSKRDDRQQRPHSRSWDERVLRIHQT
jgi:hypothetical protein